MGNNGGSNLLRLTRDRNRARDLRDRAFHGELTPEEREELSVLEAAERDRAARLA